MTMRSFSGPRLEPEAFFETRGYIIGVVNLYDVQEREDVNDPWAGDEPWCWLVNQGRLLASPIPMTGRLGVFPLDAAIERKVRTQLARAEPEKISVARLMKLAPNPVRRGKRR